jgi:O-antigen/teichoic acid export membrane protein
MRVFQRIEFLVKQTAVRGFIGTGSMSLVIKGLSGVLTYAALVLLARVMSTADFGRLGLGLSIASFFAVVASGGLQIAILRWIPEFRAQGDENRARAAMYWSLRRTLTLASIVAAATAISVFVFLGEIRLTHYLVAAAVLIVPLALADYLGNVLRIGHSVLVAIAPRDVLWRVIICTVAGVCVYAGITLNAFQAVVLYLLPIVAIVAVQAYLTVRIFSGASHHASSKQIAKWQQTASPIWVYSIIYAASVYVDVAIVSLFLSASATGPYFAALRTANILQLAHISTVAVIAPLISKHYYAGERHELQRMLKISIALVAGPTLITFTLIVIFGRWLLALFNPEFVTAYPALVILSLGYTVHALSGPVSYLLQLSGHERDNLKIIAVGYGCGLVIQLLTIPWLGYTGAALGSCLGIIGWNIWSRAVAIRKTGVDPTVMSLISFLRGTTR